MEGKLKNIDLVEKLKEYTKKLMHGPEHAEYAELQLTWNQKILEETIEYILKPDGNAIGIGSFQGAVEMALSNFYKNVYCVDHQNFLPKWKPDNILFHKTNIDSGNWSLPEVHFEICYFVEVIEHLLWSPLPLLKWIHSHCDRLVVSTPDDFEWPDVENYPWTRYQHFSAIPSAVPDSVSNPNPMFHCKQYGQSEFIELLNFANFRVEKFFRVGEGSHQMVAVCTPRQN